MRNVSVIACAIMAILLVMGTKAAKPAATAPLPGKSPLDLDQLSTMGRADFESALLAKIRERAKEEALIVDEIGSPSSAQGQLAAVYLAGTFRMSSAVRALAANITLYDPNIHMKGYSPFGGWAAAQSLAHIGNPAVPEMIRVLRVSKDPAARQLSIIVLRGILGATLARQALEDAIAEGHYAAKSVDSINLSDAANSIESAHSPTPPGHAR